LFDNIIVAYFLGHPV